MYSKCSPVPFPARGWESSILEGPLPFPKWEEDWKGSGSTPMWRPLENWLQELVIPPFPQTLDAITSCIFRCTTTAAEPRRAHRSAAADGGPSKALHTHREVHADQHLPLLPTLWILPPHPSFPFPSQLLSLLAGSHLQHSSAWDNLWGAAHSSSPPRWADSGRQALKTSPAAMLPPQQQETAN